MIFRKTRFEDIPDVVRILDDGKKFLRENNVLQWHLGYPNEEVIELDIMDETGYVATLEGGLVIGTVALSFAGEPWYDEIYDGAWLTNDDFLVIHRIATKSDFREKNVASFLLEEAEKLCLERGIKSIKIDTHIDNEIMKNWILKHGFKYCGVVHIDNNETRLAYEKII